MPDGTEIEMIYTKKALTQRITEGDATEVQLEMIDENQVVMTHYFLLKDRWTTSVIASRLVFAELESSAPVVKMRLTFLGYDEPKDKEQMMPKGFKIYNCSECGETNVKKEIKNIRVGFCDNCDHPLWNK